VVAAEKSESDDASQPALARWIDRVGAALAAPKLALAVSDTPQGRGRASSDIALLLLIALVARETHLFVTAGWLLWDGEWAGAFMVLASGAQKYLIVGVILLLAGSVLLSLLAGRRRSIADDFDLVCVALTPLVALELANAFFFALGVDLHPAGIVIGYTWFAFLWILGLMQTRTRELAE
jgi:hypothetical protein